MMVALLFALLLPFGLKADVPGGYAVTVSSTGTPVAGSPFNNLAAAVTAVPATNVPHTITLTGNDPAMGASQVSVLTNKVITLTSGAGGPYTITQATAGQRHLLNNGNITLTLTNIILDGANTAGGITFNGGNLTLNSGGVIQNCIAPSNGGNYFGGGVFNQNGTLTMNAGSRISGNEAATQGGGVANQNGTFNMYGGEISGNTVLVPTITVYAGGGVSCSNAVGQTAPFNMYDGEISGNTAGQGAGVFIHTATFTMSGGEISGNTTTSGGAGGVDVNVGGTFIMSGGKIRGNNTAAGAGGGLSVAPFSTFTMSDGEITGNEAGMGGGVYVVGDVMNHGDASFDMSGGLIAGNTATYYGGGVSNQEGVFTMTGGEISGNEAVFSSGGGVWIFGVGTLDMSGGSIINNTAGSDGGGFLRMTTTTPTAIPRNSHRKPIR